MKKIPPVASKKKPKLVPWFSLSIVLDGIYWVLPTRN